jgi:hypothetical protein
MFFSWVERSSFTLMELTPWSRGLLENPIVAQLVN